MNRKIQILRAFAIIAVVVIHTIAGGGREYLFDLLLILQWHYLFFFQVI